jgi:hypothetical protein
LGETQIMATYIHTIKDGKLSQQGEVLEDLGNAVLRVQLFSWLFGEPNGVVDIDTKEIHCMVYTNIHTWIKSSVVNGYQT